MTFLWPELLWLLLAVPILIGVYVWLLRRKKKLAVRYASLTMIKDALGAGGRIRRHVPPLLFLISLTLMLIAVGRPAAVVTLPSQHETIILAMDVSGSMRAVDVQPNRLTAAQEAARAFINDQPHNVKIGIVSFAGTAAVVQPPTENRDDLFAAIDRFTLQRGTAVGSGILVSLKTIFPEIEFDLGRTNPRINASDTGKGRPFGRGKGGDKASSADKDQDQAKSKDVDKPVQPGSYESAAIILLTDGQTTTGPDPIEAAKMAADRGVRVYTVGIGTVAGEIIGAEGWSMRVRLDEEALKQIANTTRGDYFYAGTATDLKKIYEGMNSKMVLKKQQTEITALFVAAAAIFATLAAGLSLVWFNRVL
jgi:Ca-activated chloride channel family protein